MQETESFEIPEFKDIEYHMACAGRALGQLKCYELLDRLEELAGDIEEAGLQFRAKLYK